MKRKTILAFVVAAIAVFLSGLREPQDTELRRLRLALANCELKSSEAERQLRQARELQDKTKDVTSLLRRAESAEAMVLRVEEAARMLRQENESLKQRLEQCESKIPKLQTTPDPPTVVASGKWSLFETTNINGAVQEIQHGTVFKTLSGNIYEVSDIVMLLEMEFNPTVTVFSNGVSYKLLIDGVNEVLLCNRIGGNAGTDTGSALIESRIDGTFDGFENGKIFKLQNGQIWEQTNFRIRVAVRLSPSVMIWRDGAVWKMRVERESDIVTVHQLK